MPTFVMTGGTSEFGAITATAPRSKLMTALAATRPITTFRNLNTDTTLAAMLDE